MGRNVGDYLLVPCCQLADLETGVESMAVVKRHAGRWLILVAAVGLAFQSAPRKNSQEFKEPAPFIFDSDARVLPKLAWVTTTWSVTDDAPYKIIASEVEPARAYRGLDYDKEGKWARKVQEAYDQWFEDCQSSLKLFRVTAYMGVLKEADQTAARSKQNSEMWRNVHLGWLTVKNPSRSYFFVRGGYLATAGNHFRHIYGDLARELLKKNPNDRGVFRAAVGELFDEKPLWNDKLQKSVQLPGTGKQFEEFLLETGLRLKKTDPKNWRPWQDSYLGQIYLVRALRSKKRSDLKIAVGYLEAAIAGSPKNYAGLKELVDNRALLKEYGNYMKYD